MGLINFYIRLVAFTSCLLAGIQIPGFAELYGQKLEANLAEASQHYAGYQLDADKYFSGNIYELAEHYANSNDMIMRGNAAHIYRVDGRIKALQAAQDQFGQSEVYRYLHLLHSAVDDVLAQTWQSYNFVVLLTADAITTGVILALLLLVLLEVLLSIFGLAITKTMILVGNVNH